VSLPLAIAAHVLKHRISDMAKTARREHLIRMWPTLLFLRLSRAPELRACLVHDADACLHG
jgi:hypothetical protein